MATQTRIVGTIYEPGGETAELSYDYDDVTLRISAARIVNGLSTAVRILLLRESDQRAYGPFTVAAQSTVTQSVTTSGATRIQLRRTAASKLDGCSMSLWG